jgi:hypothetical protein
MTEGAVETEEVVAVAEEVVAQVVEEETKIVAGYWLLLTSSAGNKTRNKKLVTRNFIKCYNRKDRNTGRCRRVA